VRVAVLRFVNTGAMEVCGFPELAAVGRVSLLASDWEYELWVAVDGIGACGSRICG